MGKNRLEAFSDGVLAIIITIMVLEMKVPHGGALASLEPLIPVFLSYILSFIYLGIYWNNHHHLMHTVKMINGSAMWANMHLLFWLSLIPFTTGWMGENHFTTWPVVAYGFVLVMAAIAYYILAHCLSSIHGKDSVIAKALGTDFKGRVSVLLYAIGIGLSFIHPALGMLLYTIVAFMWLIPDRRIERYISEFESKE